MVYKWVVIFKKNKKASEKQVQTPHVVSGIVSKNDEDWKGILLNAIKTNYCFREHGQTSIKLRVSCQEHKASARPKIRGDRLINGRCPGCKVLCAIPSNVLMDCLPPVRLMTLVPAQGLIITGWDFGLRLDFVCLPYKSFTILIIALHLLFRSFAQNLARSVANTYAKKQDKTGKCAVWVGMLCYDHLFFSSSDLKTVIHCYIHNSGK